MRNCCERLQIARTCSLPSAIKVFAPSAVLIAGLGLLAGGALVKLVVTVLAGALFEELLFRG